MNKNIEILDKVFTKLNLIKKDYEKKILELNEKYNDFLEKLQEDELLEDQANEKSFLSEFDYREILKNYSVGIYSDFVSKLQNVVVDTILEEAGGDK